MNQDSTNKKKRVFMCNFCNQSSCDKSSLNKHLKRCKKNPEYKHVDMICACGKEFLLKKCLETHKANCMMTQTNLLKQIIQPPGVTNISNSPYSVVNNSGNVNVNSNNPVINVHIENYNKEIKLSEIDPVFFQNALDSAPSDKNIAHHLIGELLKYIHFNNGSDVKMNKYKNIYRNDMTDSYDTYLCVFDNTWEKTKKTTVIDTVHDNLTFIVARYSVENDNCLEEYFVTGYGNKKYNLHDFILNIWNPQTPLDKVNAKESLNHIENIISNRRGIVKHNYETTNFRTLEEGQYVI